MMTAVRYIVRFVKRARNRISSYINLLRLNLYGVEHGKHCVIHGKLYINLFPSASLKIGDDFYFSSGWGINALCSNRRGMLYATWDANITIGNNVGMSSTVLWCHKKIVIGNNVKIGGNCILIDTDAHDINYINRRRPATDSGATSPIIIEDDAFIGTNCIILKGVTIGARSIIAAGSIVTKSIPADCIAGGNPAKVIKYL